VLVPICTVETEPSIEQLLRSTALGYSPVLVVMQGGICPFAFHAIHTLWQAESGNDRPASVRSGLPVDFVGVKIFVRSLRHSVDILHEER
jgi:hypothetical protein